jgi:hypothetical protein
VILKGMAPTRSFHETAELPLSGKFSFPRIFERRASKRSLNRFRLFPGQIRQYLWCGLHEADYFRRKYDVQQARHFLGKRWLAGIL